MNSIQKRAENIGIHAGRSIARINKEAHASLKKLGYGVGCLIERLPCRYYKHSVYRITRVCENPSKYSGYYFYGQKLRKDGSFGTHIHSIGSAEHHRPYQEQPHD